MDDSKKVLIINDQEIRHICLEFEDTITSHESMYHLPAVVASTIFKLYSLWYVGEANYWPTLPAVDSP